jgi:primosomal protein N'
MLADVVFDAPLHHPFSYSIPPDMGVAVGQRVLAPLGGALRAGIVIALRPEPANGGVGLRMDVANAAMKALASVLEPGPVLSASQLELARWVAAESGSSLGSTCAALLPPPSRSGPIPALAEWTGGDSARCELFIGGDRELRLMAELGRRQGGVLVITADVEAAAHWEAALAATGEVARLDSGAPERQRQRGWAALAAGDVRIGIGTRSALLAPLSRPSTLVLIDEHEPAHKPPGPPRIHAREVLLRRAAGESSDILMTAATPSGEMWWRAESGLACLRRGAPGVWPAVTIADTRGFLRAEPLTPALTRATHEALARGQRVCLLVSRLTSALACGDCGEVPRCSACGIALEFSRIAKTVACALCRRRDPAPETCPTCGGRKLSPFGWSAERVEHAVRRRFPRARIARYDPDAARGARLCRQRENAGCADVVIGTRGALRLFPAGTLGLAGFVALDQVLRVPDFRAGERAFALMWAAAEKVAPGGQLVIQSQNAEHYAIRAVSRQDLGEFYKHELHFRAELGYPPFRQLCRLTVRAPSERAARDLADACARRLAAPGRTVYPPMPERRGAAVRGGSAVAWRIIVKGPAGLPAEISRVVAELGVARRGGRDMIEAEMDPVD